MTASISKLDLCEGGSFSTAIFNSDIQLSVDTFSCFISVCPFVALLNKGNVCRKCACLVDIKKRSFFTAWDLDKNWSIPVTCRYSSYPSLFQLSLHIPVIPPSPRTCINTEQAPPVFPSFLSENKIKFAKVLWYKGGYAACLKV